MHDNQPKPTESCDYEVIVGHNRIRVRGRDRWDAVRQARNRLCVDHPRLWDVIQSLEIKCFEIRQV